MPLASSVSAVSVIYFWLYCVYIRDCSYSSANILDSWVYWLQLPPQARQPLTGPNKAQDLCDQKLHIHGIGQLSNKFLVLTQLRMLDSYASLPAERILAQSSRATGRANKSLFKVADGYVSSSRHQKSKTECLLITPSSEMTYRQATLPVWDGTHFLKQPCLQCWKQVNIGVAHLSGVLIMFMLNIGHGFPSWAGLGS